MRTLVFLLLTAAFAKADPVDAVFRTPLSEAGQSGVCVSGDRVYLTVHAKLTGELKGGFRYSKDIVGQCFDRKSGERLWEIDLPGSHPGLVLETWHDATSLTPLADKDYVYFHNLNGMLAAVTHDGKLAWKREWKAPDPDIKNCRMFLHEGVLIVSLPSEKIAVKASKSHPDLPYYQLHGIDVSTGKDRWVSPELLSHATQYSLDTWKGMPVVAASIIDLSHYKFNRGCKGYLITPTDGKTEVTFNLPPVNPHQRNQLFQGKFLVTSNADKKKTCFQLIDPETGEITKEYSFENPDAYYAWSGTKYELSEFAPRFTDNILKGKAMPTPSTVHAVGDRIYFWRYDTNAIGCIDKTGKSILVEVPTQEIKNKSVWMEKDFQFTKGILNSSGTVVNNRVGTVRGVIRGGFGHTNPAWPVLRDDHLFWQGGAGLLYIINVKKPFSPETIRWRSIDETGRSLTFGEPAVDDRHLFIRSQCELVKFPR